MTESITVVKLGGAEGVDFSAICADAAELLTGGRKLVFVHGGSAVQCMNLMLGLDETTGLEFTGLHPI